MGQNIVDTPRDQDRNKEPWEYTQVKQQQTSISCNTMRISWDFTNQNAVFWCYIMEKCGKKLQISRDLQGEAPVC